MKKKRRVTRTKGQSPYKSCQKSVPSISRVKGDREAEGANGECHGRTEEEPKLREGGGDTAQPIGKQKRSVTFQVDAVQRLLLSVDASRRGTRGRAKEDVLPTMLCDTNVQHHLSPSDEENPSPPTMTEVLEQRPAAMNKDATFHVVYREKENHCQNIIRDTEAESGIEVSSKQRAIDTLQERFCKTVSKVLQDSYSSYGGTRC